MSVPRRRLGQGVEVAAQGLGCMGMSQSYGVGDDAQSRRTIERALDLGVNFLDTADMYGPFHNERLVGEAIASRRDEVFLATKFGNERLEDGTFVRVNGTPEYVRAACDASLARLGVERIDLYYQHRVDPTVPIEETWGAMSELVTAGKVAYLGISEAAPETVRRAHRVHPMIASQNEYSLFSRDPEDELLATLRELDIALVAYSPLGRGFLTGQIRSRADFGPGDFRASAPRFSEENFARNLELVAHLAELAADKGATPGQVALAWVLAQGEDVVPIPGTKRVAYLEENAGAHEVVLFEDELAAIEAIVPRRAVAGERFGPEQMARVNL